MEEIFKVDFLCGSSKESACSAGDLGLVTGLGRSPGEVKGTHSSIQYSSLENSLDTVHGVTKSQIPLSDFHFSIYSMDMTEK